MTMMLIILMAIVPIALSGGLQKAIGASQPKCHFNPIGVYKKAPEVPGLLKEVNRIAPFVGIAKDVASNAFPVAGTIVGVALSMADIMTPTQDIDHRSFQKAVNAEFDRVYECIGTSVDSAFAKDSSESLQAKIENFEIHLSNEWYKYKRTQFITDFKDIYDDLRAVATKSSFSPNKNLFRAEAVLPAFDIALPFYISSLMVVQAELYTLCTEAKDKAACHTYDANRKVHKKYIDDILRWMGDLKGLLYKEYETWRPKFGKCKVSYKDPKYEKPKYVRGRRVYYRKVKEIKCGSYVYTKGISSLDIKFGSVYTKKGHYSGCYEYFAWRKDLSIRGDGGESYKKRICFEAIEKYVNDEIKAYNEDLKVWKKNFDALYVKPLDEFKFAMTVPMDAVKYCKSSLYKPSSVRRLCRRLGAVGVGPFGGLFEGFDEYAQYAIAFSPFVVCLLINAICARKHCRSEKGNYEKVELIVEDEEEKIKLNDEVI